MRPFIVHRVIIFTFLLLTSTVGAQHSQPYSRQRPLNPQDFKQSLIDHIQAALGTEVRIKDIRYEILNSKFVCRDIEVGPKSKPLLRLPLLTLEMALLAAGQGTTVPSILAQGAQAHLPAATFERPFQYRSHRPLAIRSLKITQGQLTIQAINGSSIQLRNATLELTDLELRPDRSRLGAAIKGALAIKATGFQVGAIEFAELEVEGKFSGNKITVTRLLVDGMGGKTQLSGTIGFKNGRLGNLRLQGTTKLHPFAAEEPKVWGSVKLAGRTIGNLSLTGKLKSSASLPLSISNSPAGLAPSLKINLKIGKKTLTGNLAKLVWR